jgi:hypothetical protein
MAGVEPACLAAADFKSAVSTYSTTRTEYTTKLYNKILLTTSSNYYYINTWCLRPESNRYTLRRGILSPLRLPISPLRHILQTKKKHSS